jgi:hypothetical protein
MTQLELIAIDQWGETIHLGDCRHPRQELLAALGKRSAKRMYRDTRNGRSKHIGYVIGSRWFTLYRVYAWTGSTTERQPGGTSRISLEKPKEGGLHPRK